MRFPSSASVGVLASLNYWHYSIQLFRLPHPGSSACSGDLPFPHLFRIGCPAHNCTKLLQIVGRLPTKSSQGISILNSFLPWRRGWVQRLHWSLLEFYKLTVQGVRHTGAGYSSGRYFSNTFLTSKLCTRWNHLTGSTIAGRAVERL